MKIKRCMITGGVLAGITIVLFLSTLFFPLKENDLIKNTMQSASDHYHQKVISYEVCDSRFSNDNLAYIYQFILEDGEEKYYAVSYERHLFLPRYRFASWTDFFDPDKGSVLIAPGMPLETVYDISNYSLEYENSTLNYTLVETIHILITAVLLFFILFGIRLYKKESRSRDSA